MVSKVCRFHTRGRHESRPAGLVHRPEGADEYVSYDTPAGVEHYKDDGRLKKKFYEHELARLQQELVKLQYWVVQQGLRVAIIFERLQNTPLMPTPPRTSR